MITNNCNDILFCKFSEIALIFGTKKLNVIVSDEEIHVTKLCFIVQFKRLCEV